MNTAQKMRRPMWLRWLLGMLLLLVAMVAMFVIYHQFDEDLDPATAAWLTYQSPVIPDKDNAYLALYSLESEAPNRLAVAASTVERLQQIANSGSPTEANYEQALLALKIKERNYLELEAVCAKNQPCLASLKQQQTVLSSQRKEHAELLTRYTAMLAMPAFNELLVKDMMNMPILRYTASTKLGLLYWSTLPMQLEAQQYRAALQQWAQHQQFWLRAAKGSNSLINLMIASHQLQRGNLLLQEMLDAYPESKTEAKNIALPILQASQNLRPSFTQSMLGEFQLTSPTIASLKNKDVNHFDLSYLGLNLLQANATLNFFHDMLAWNFSTMGLTLPGFDLGEAPQRNPCENPNYFANPVGKILACIAEPDYQQYLKRVTDVEQGSKALAAQLAKP